SHAVPVRVEENLVGIEPHAVRGIEWPVNAICVELSRPQILHEYVPIMVRAVGCGIDRDYPRGLRIIFPVKEQQLYTRGVPRVDAEVDASRHYGGAKRRASAEPLHTSRRTSARRHS